MPSSTDQLGYQGNLDVSGLNGGFNALAFVIQQLMGGMATATLVQVESCTNDGGVSAVGLVNVHPLVNQLDGAGSPVPHGVLYSLPYMRAQGGANAVILDPQVGDIGVAVFADHDISAVKSSKAQANPGSRRRFDLSDGLYLGGFLNGVPTQYVQFTDAGMNIVSPNTVTIQAPDIFFDGNVDSNGTFKNNGVNIGSTHTHGGVVPGGGNSGGPH